MYSEEILSSFCQSNRIILERFEDMEIDTIIDSTHKVALVTVNCRIATKVWIRKHSGKVPLH